MSYNIDSSEYISGKLRIRVGDALQLFRKYENDLPECTFLEDIDYNAIYEDDFVVIENPRWYGCGSGYSYEDTLRRCLEKTRGKAVIAFIWEGGDSKTALEVNDGVVKEKKVKMVVDE